MPTAVKLAILLRKRGILNQRLLPELGTCPVVWAAVFFSGAPRIFDYQHMKVARLSALRGRLYPPPPRGNPGLSFLLEAES